MCEKRSEITPDGRVESNNEVGDDISMPGGIFSSRSDMFFCSSSTCFASSIKVELLVELGDGKTSSGIF